jgi:hypothetical protein
MSAAEAYSSPMARIDTLALELFTINRNAAQRPHRLVGKLSVLSGFHRVEAEPGRDDEERVHFILHRLIPEYLDRLPTGTTFMGIRELFKWRADNGEPQSLQARYDNAVAAMGGFRCADFARRWEPKLTRECAVVFNQLDHDDRLSARRVAPDPGADTRQADSAGPLPPGDPGIGIIGVHERLDVHEIADGIRAATDVIAILNTFIPAIALLEEPLADALGNGVCVRILLLHPGSRAVSLRSQALPGTRGREDRVRREIKYCLDVLGDLAGGLDDEARGRLQVRVYDSLPSLAVYRIDERAWASIFVHGQVANDAPQVELGTGDSLFGRTVFGELEWLWNIAWEFQDVRRWVSEIDEMLPGTTEEA